MLRQRLSEALKAAMRERADRAVATIRLILAAIKDRDIAARGHGNTDGISEAEIVELLDKMIRQRGESIALYEQGGRLELAAQEQEEIEIIRRFLPRQLDDAEVAAAVEGVIAELDASSIKDMGRIMAELRNRYAGSMDFAKAAAEAKAHFC
jgi:uncharacterized protein